MCEICAILLNCSGASTQSYYFRGVGNSNFPLLLSFSERFLPTYLLIRLSFSLFSLFLANWTFLFSYFLPLPPSLSTPFSYLLPSVVHGDIKYRYTTCRSSRNMPQKSICHPLPKFSFPFLPASLSFLRIRKFSYCLSFSFFLTYFFLFLLISFSRFLFRSFFSFPCSQAKSAKKICSFFKKI